MAEEPIRRAYDLLVQKMGELEAHYRMKQPIREKFYDEAWSVLGAETLSDAIAISDRVYKKSRDHCILQWANKRADGPLTPEWCEEKAKGHERFAKLKTDKGDTAAAEKDLQRAAEYWQQAEQLRRS